MEVEPRARFSVVPQRCRLPGYRSAARTGRRERALGAARAKRCGYLLQRQPRPTASDLGAVRAAIVCLHSQIRAEHHLPLLTENATLRGAAVGHSTNMVSNRYFEHTDPSGITLMDRLLGAHYVGRNQDWVMGENLAWATGVESTPAGSVPGLDGLARPPCQHPAPLLPRRRRRRRDRRTADGNIGATYTAGFGARRQSPGGLPPKR
jgi:cysteine-rich secretory family protein